MHKPHAGLISGEKMKTCGSLQRKDIWFSECPLFRVFPAPGPQGCCTSVQGWEHWKTAGRTLQSGLQQLSLQSPTNVPSTAPVENCLVSTSYFVRHCALKPLQSLMSQSSCLPSCSQITTLLGAIFICEKGRQGRRSHQAFHLPERKR